MDEKDPSRPGDDSLIALIAQALELYADRIGRVLAREEGISDEVRAELTEIHRHLQAAAADGVRRDEGGDR